MGQPPGQLDGADVLCWVASARGGFCHLAGFDPPVAVTGMAVARYAGGGPFYLFKCDSRWSVVQDWDCGSIEEACALAAEHSGEEPLVWHPVAAPERGGRGTTGDSDGLTL
ncbi:MAG: hypothetical protein ACRC33_15480 [Gemmataceae bacterium]